MMLRCWVCGQQKKGSVCVWRDYGEMVDHLVCEDCYRKKTMLEFPTTPPEPNREKYPLEDFMAQVAKRLEKGAVEYGAESYLFDNVTRQIKEELEDVAGWASLQWAKVGRIQELWAELQGLIRSEEG